MTDVLLPCPFCGSTDLGVDEEPRGSGWVYCGTCSTEGPYKGNRRSAIKAWNTRPLVGDAPASVIAERNEGEDTFRRVEK